MSANKWAALITKSIKMREDVIPKGFYSRKQMEKIWNVSKGEANQRLKELLQRGLIEKKSFLVKDARGVCPVLHLSLIHI